MTLPEDMRVRLDKYTLAVVCGEDRHRWWTPLDGPILHFWPDLTCLMLMDGETLPVSLLFAEQLLISLGFIDPALDNPDLPVYPWRTNEGWAA
jgi:hypothetical protein